MAPAGGSLNFQRDGGDDNHGSDNNDNNNDDFGKGSSSDSGSSPPKDSIPQSPPFKEITREVTVTRISTAIQTATIFLSSSSGSSSSFSSSSSPSPSILPTTTQSSTRPASAATSSFSTSAPLSSSADLNSPSNSSAHDGSPSLSHKPLEMKTSIPIASIISIILGSLFFITLCLVVYVRSRRFQSRLAGLFRKRHTAVAPTISSFEPKEFRDFSRNTNFRRSARSFVVLTDIYSTSGQSATSRAPFSPPRGKDLLALNAPSYESSSYRSPQDSYSQERHRVASSEIHFPEIPPSRSISVFDDYPFEHDATDIMPNSTDGRPTEDRSNGFPQSVHDMTVE